MPAPEVTNMRSFDSRPALGHVNLMIDTFIANASVDDLRSIMRNLLATGPPDVSPAFANAARSRLRQTYAKAKPNPYILFRRQARDSEAVALPHLFETLARARSMYGAGLGFASLGILTSVVRATIGLRWEDDGDTVDVLAHIDADIGQAIQSAKEELDGGRVNDFSAAQDAVQDLRRAIQDSLNEVNSWGGEFPFERGLSSLQCWKF
ncbi:hypothetical protein FA15DRAFT_619710 [Coprinopsis marcescibilis]|uniref:Uncharacterized protein n=1 Tax=Coprinopsis marcescibilis TaxID=230819 RepID=A0A5C3KUA3_COPMA|nr:hypothetical protein FA15DRAFT_619710 [Coprinopsis marcescibilis]